MSDFHRNRIARELGISPEAESFEASPAARPLLSGELERTREQNLARAEQVIVETLTGRGVSRVAAFELVERAVIFDPRPGARWQPYIVDGSYRATGTTEEHLAYFAKVLHNRFHDQVGGAVGMDGPEPPSEQQLEAQERLRTGIERAKVQAQAEREQAERQRIAAADADFREQSERLDPRRAF